MAEHQIFEELFKEQIAKDEKRRATIKQLAEESARDWQRALEHFEGQLGSQMKAAAQHWIDHQKRMDEEVTQRWTDHLKQMGIPIPKR